MRVRVCVGGQSLGPGCATHARARSCVCAWPGVWDDGVGRGGRWPGPALRCRWAGPAVGPAALAALGSRPRRARRAGLGLRGGAGTGSGKQQRGGGGALPVREPSAGRRTGAAVSRDRGPRSTHGRRGGECRQRPGATGAGADLGRGDAPPGPAPSSRTPGLRPASPPSYGPRPESRFPGSPPLPLLRGAPLRPLPGAGRRSPSPRGPAFRPHASDAHFSPGCTLGCAPRGARSGRPAGSCQAFSEAPGRPYPPSGPGSPRSRGRAHTVVPSPLGTGPGNRQHPAAARPWARDRHGTGLCSHLADKIEPALEAWGAGRGRGRWRFGERNRQVRVYFQKRRGGAEGVRQVSAQGVQLEEI